jgi:hypothetical protein
MQESAAKQTQNVEPVSKSFKLKSALNDFKVMKFYEEQRKHSMSSRSFLFESDDFRNVPIQKYVHSLFI